MDNMSDFSDASSKQWFGDLSGFGMHSHCLAGATDRLNECQVIEDHAELPSDFSFEKLWLNLDKKQDVELPWEKGNWKSIFGSAQQFAIGSSQVFSRPNFEPMPPVLDSDVEAPCKRLRTSPFANHWKQVVTTVDAVSWSESQEAKLDTALKRWYDLVLRFPLGIAIKDQLALLAEVSDQLRVLRDVFATKSPLTLIKRANSLQRYVNFLDNQGMLFPGDEATLYQHFCAERQAGSPSSRLQSVVEALRFSEHVLGVSQLCAELLSKRVIGASKYQTPGPRRQASPFTVKELKVLHSILQTDTEDMWDRVMAGATLCAVYSRSRWSDIQHAESMEADPSQWDPIFLEFKVLDHKTKRANAWSEGFLPAVAVAHGVTLDNWAATWLVVRSSIGGSIADGFPLMPAPGMDDEPTKRPLSSDEMGKWVRMLFERHNIDLSGRKITSHSCKSTLLSYMAKFGCDIPTREILGGHVSHLKSVLTYSRDSLAGPLRELEKCLQAIRSMCFSPDASRSGRFIEVCKIEDADGADRNLVDASETGPKANGNNDEPQTVDSDSSSEAPTDTDTSSDEEASAVGRPTRLVRCPTAPQGTSLIQHSKSKMLHLMADGYRRIFLCGRQKGESHSPPSQVRWDSPCCSLCWKAAKTKLGPRIEQP